VFDAVDGVSALALLQVGQDLDVHNKRSNDENSKVHHHNHHHHTRKHPVHTGIKRLHGLKSHEKKHSHTAVVDHSQLPTGLLSIRSEPRDDAEFAGVLEKGATFKVSSAQEAPDGKVWLHLADGRGWVPKDHVAELQQAPAEATASEAPAEATASKAPADATASTAAPPVATQAEETPKKEIDAKKESPKRSQEEIREEYKKIPMKEAGLHDQLEHNHGQTINADWRNEYPYKHDPNEQPSQPAWYGTAATQSFSFAIGLSIAAALAS